jgi:hypothetical protein
MVGVQRQARGTRAAGDALTRVGDVGIWNFRLGAVPGLLQTEDYARAVISRSVKLESPVQENLHDLHADQDDQDDDARASRDQVAQEQL